MRKPTNLIILGNGFDLYFGLSTKYSDFVKYLSSYKQEEKKYIQQLQLFDVSADSNELWLNFEEKLSFINKDVLNDFDDFEELKALFGLIDNANKIIGDLFSSWIKSLKCNVDKEKYFLQNFISDSFFINFNYTLTAEKNFNVKKSDIYHIHGTAHGNIVFGHKPVNIVQNYLDAFEANALNNTKNTRIQFEKYSLVEDLLKKTEKSTQKIIKNFKKLLINNFDIDLSKVENIYIIGISYSEVDYPYFEYLSNHINAKWYFGWHTLNDKQRASFYLQKLKIKNYLFYKNEELINLIMEK